jgi:hypothetical protein
MDTIEFSLSHETKECALITRMYRRGNSIFTEVNKKSTFFVTVEPGKLADAPKKLREKAKEELAVDGLSKDDIQIISRHVSGEIMNNIDKLRDLEEKWSKNSTTKKIFTVDDIWDEDGKLDRSKLTPDRLQHLHDYQQVLFANKVTKTRIDTNNTLFKGLNSNSQDERYNSYEKFGNLRSESDSRVLYEAFVFRNPNIANSNNGTEDSLTTRTADSSGDNKNGDLFLEDADQYSTKFVYFDKEHDEFKAVDYVIKDNRIILPTPSAGTPSIPYEFVNIEHLNLFYKREVKGKVTISTLFESFFHVYIHYNKQPIHVCVSRAAGIVLSYFVDLFPVIAYFGSMGIPGSGKSTECKTFKFTAYRATSMTNPNSAQAIRLFGNVEPAQFTLIADEADKIDDDSDFMSMIKEGYSYDAVWQKVNDHTRNLDFFFLYGMKIWSAEIAPTMWKTMGWYDRTFVTMTKRQPQTSKDPNVKNLSLDIGLSSEDKYWKSLILKTRKQALLYRMITYNNQLPILDINVGGRDKELVYPFIQLFYNSPYQNYVTQAMQKLLDEMNKIKRISLSTILCIKIGTYLYSHNTTKIRLIDFWDELRQDTNFGTYMQDISGKNKWIDTPDYGEIRQQMIALEFRNNLSAKLDHTRSGNVWVFDLDAIINRLKTFLYVSSRIKANLINREGCEGCEPSSESAIKYLKRNLSVKARAKTDANIMTKKFGKLWSLIQKLEDLDEDKKKTKTKIVPVDTEHMDEHEIDEI